MLVACPFLGKGQLLFLFKEAINGNEGQRAQHKAHAVEGKGGDKVAAQHLRHEGKAPNDGGGEKQDVGYKLILHKKSFIG